MRKQSRRMGRALSRNLVVLRPSPSPCFSLYIFVISFTEFNSLDRFYKSQLGPVDPLWGSSQFILNSTVNEFF